MSTKHLFNSSDGLVLKSLRGAVILNPSLRLHTPSKAVFVAEPSPNARVAVISGGGAGHEPAHASYTGRGMLSASVSGDIFASPSAEQILNTIKLAAFPGGDFNSPSSKSKFKDVLVIINNYTGDRLNFGLAVEKARVALPGIEIESVVVADDVSLLQDSDKSLVGPRGLGGNILVCKILGALAERGCGIREMKAFGDAVVSNLASIGVGLDHCHVPGRSIANNKLGNMECEIGLGLHNEPGVTKTQLKSPQDLISQMLSMIMNSNASEEFIRNNETLGRDEVVLFINNLGGMSQLEMGCVVDETVSQLAQLKIYPRRIYSSAYMTSLNAPGFSISILNVSRIQQTNSRGNNINIYDLLDDPTEALSWIGARTQWSTNVKAADSSSSSSVDELLENIDRVSGLKHDSGHIESDVVGWNNNLLEGVPTYQIEHAIRGACGSILRVEEDLTRFDTIVGDGDCGYTFSSGARAILSQLNNGNLQVLKLGPSELVRHIAHILENSMGGTIGALFCIFLNAMSTSLHKPPPTSNSNKWSIALNAGMEALSRHTPAKPGDRTIVDALHPFCQSLSHGENLHRAVKRAREGAESTKGMKAKLGRAVYVGQKGSTGGGGSVEHLPPDPGAWGVYVLVQGYSDALDNLPIPKS